MNSNVDSLPGESLRNLRAKQGFSLGHSQYKQLLLAYQSTKILTTASDDYNLGSASASDNTLRIKNAVFTGSLSSEISR